MAEKVERRFTAMDAGPVEIEQRDGENPKILGLGAIYYDGTPATEYELWPGTIERIKRGAFTSLLRDGTDTMGLFNHNPDNVLGRTTAGTLRLKSTKKGLQYTIDPPDTQIGRDVTENIGRGDISGSSFSFTIAEEKWKKDEERDIREIVKVERLFDVGPVTFPAYTGTEVALRALEMDGEAPKTATDEHLTWLREAQQRSGLPADEGDLGELEAAEE